MVVISSNEFSKICKDLYSLSETVNIETTKQFIKFSVNNDSIKGGVTIEANESALQEEQCVIHSDADVNLAFALRYLNMFTKAGQLSPQVSLYLSTEFPLMIEFKITELGTLRFYLAPRISDDK